MINNRQNGRRRGRGGGQRPPNPGNTGNRQDNRQRGNAAQLHEKYKALARDSQLAGDRVQTETYLQFADHYFRVLNEGRARFEEQRRPRDEFGAEEDEDQDQDQDRGVAAQDSQDQHERDERPEGRHEFRNDSDRGGEPRQERPRFEPREVRPREEPDEERISLDVLPPAIAPSGNGAAEAEDDAPRAPRRRTRRPRPEADDEIAPAA